MCMGTAPAVVILLDIALTVVVVVTKDGRTSKRAQYIWKKQNFDDKLIIENRFDLFKRGRNGE